MAMCNVMITEKLYDAGFVERYTTGFDQLAEAVQEATPEWAQKLADVPADVITRVTREMAACAPMRLSALVTVRLFRRKRSTCGA